MARRRTHAKMPVDEAEESGELNLVPYLDIITALVIFMVFTFQVIIEFRLIELLPPGAGIKQAESEGEPELTLTLIITSGGYTLLTSDASIGTTDIPRKPDGALDTAALTKALHTMKTTHGLAGSLVLSADGKIEYREVVAAMDAARKHNGDELFPDVLLAAGVGGSP